MANTIVLEKIRMKLAKIWFIGTALPFFLMTIQSVLGKYEPKTQEAWSWFIPLVFPTLTLMVSVMGVDAVGQYRRKVIRIGFANIVVWLSFAYIGALTIVILLEPLSAQDPFKVFSISNFFLGPLQGVVVAALGYLFTHATKENERKTVGVMDSETD